MTISAQQIKELREKTGAGVSDVKRALEESGGDMNKAFKLIERKLGATAEKKMSRQTKSGIIEVYLHSNNRVASMVEVFCETDFVARNPEFKEFAHELAMHIAAMNPLYLSVDSISQDAWQAEKRNFEEEIKKLNKPEHIKEEIVSGKLKTHFGSISLLQQLFVKDQEKTVGEITNEVIGKFGENIKIGRFVRFEI